MNFRIGGDRKMFGVDQVKALNDLEMLVYGYVMKYPEKVRYMRIRELASEAHVSTSTILRFCKKMGCGGYTEFKLQLKEHLEHRGQVRIKDDISEVIDFLQKTCSDAFENKLGIPSLIWNMRHYNRKFPECLHPADTRRPKLCHRAFALPCL